jgi:hypothetical protein
MAVPEVRCAGAVFQVSVQGPAQGPGIIVLLAILPFIGTLYASAIVCNNLKAFMGSSTIWILSEFAWPIGCLILLTTGV